MALDTSPRGRGAWHRIPRRAWSLLLCSALVALAPRMASAETIVIAAEDDWAPYSSLKPNKSAPEGFAVDLVREAFKSQGIDVKFESVPFTRCMFLAKTGAVAGCFNASPVDDSRGEYVWHTTPMFKEDLAIFALASEPRRDLGLKDLEGKTAGYTLGYICPGDFMSDTRIRKRGVKSDKLLLNMLLAGRVDYILMDLLPGEMRINADPVARARIKPVGTVSTNGFWVAFSKKRPDAQRLADTFEKGLLDLKTTGRYQAMDEALRRQATAL
ncbi:transporter substrate-binding domain-containing protein [soil metagenome]